MNISDTRLNFLNFQKNIEIIRSYDLDNLLKPTRLGETNFSEIESDIKSFTEFLEAVSKVYQNEHSSYEDVFASANEHMGSILNSIESIASIENKDATYYDVKINLISSIRGQIQTIKNIVTPSLLSTLLVFSSKIKTVDDFEKFTKQAKLEFESLEKIKKVSEDKLASIDAVLKAAQEASGKAGVDSHSAVYEDDKKSHRFSAWVWLFVTAAIFVFTARMGYLAYDDIKNIILSEKPQQYLTQLLAVKAFFTALLVFGFVWTGKMYKIERNLSYINRQKENALKTFKTFWASSEDIDVKNAILSEATRSIFTISNSGLVTGSDNNDDVTKVIEIFKSATKD